MHRLLEAKVKSNNSMQVPENKINVNCRNYYFSYIVVLENCREYDFRIFIIVPV